MLCFIVVCSSLLIDYSIPHEHMFVNRFLEIFLYFFLLHLCNIYRNEGLLIDCYIFIKLLLTTALLRKFGAYGPQAARRVFQRPTVLLYFFLGSNEIKTYRPRGCVSGKKLFLIIKSVLPGNYSHQIIF